MCPWTWVPYVFENHSKGKFRKNKKGSSRKAFLERKPHFAHAQHPRDKEPYAMVPFPQKRQKAGPATSALTLDKYHHGHISSDLARGDKPSADFSLSWQKTRRELTFPVMCTFELLFFSSANCLRLHRHPSTFSLFQGSQFVFIIHHSSTSTQLRHDGKRCRKDH